MQTIELMALQLKCDPSDVRLALLNLFFETRSSSIGSTFKLEIALEDVRKVLEAKGKIQKKKLELIKGKGAKN